MPGAGGTQRLPRLVGLADGARPDPDRPHPEGARGRSRPGSWTRSAPAPVLLEAARRAALRARRPASCGPSREGIGSRGAAAAADHLLQGARVGAGEDAAATTRRRSRRSRSCEQGTADDAWPRASSSRPRRSAGSPVGDVSRALVSVFFATQEIKKDAGVPRGHAVRRRRASSACSGAGLMGAGHRVRRPRRPACRCASRTRPLEALGRGLQHARGVCEERRKRRSLTRARGRAAHGPHLADARLRGFAARRPRDRGGVRGPGAEAPGARRGRRRRPATSACSRATPRRSRSARSRTGCRRPEQRARACTSSRRCTRCRCSRSWSRPRPTPAALATAVAFGRRLGKHVIVVRDGPGLLHEPRARRLHERGDADARGGRRRSRRSTAAMTDFGFPVGPCTLLDEVGIDVAARRSRR